MFRDAVAGFANDEVRPRVQQMERDGKIDPALITKFFEMGLMGIEVAEEYGGAGGSLLHDRARRRGAQQGRRGRGDPHGRAEHARQLSDPHLRQRLHQVDVPAAAHRREGRRVRAVRGVVGLRRVRHADARRAEAATRWILNGRKMWITNGAEAEIYVVFANANPSAGYKGITAFVVERGFKGFSVGKKEDKLGIRASSTTELILDDVEVPAENVLGPVGQGYKVAIETLNEGRIGIGAQMIGVAGGALHAATEYVKERTQFGKKLADFQGIQFQLAQARTELEAARLMVYNAARLKDAGKDIAHGRRDGEAVLVAGRRARDVDLARAVRRLRLHEGLSGREVLSRREDRRDLRRHEQHAAADDREGDAQVGSNASRESRAQRRYAIAFETHRARSPARLSMKAIRVHDKGGPEVLKLEDVADPTPGPGELLIDVEAVGVNFIEIYSARRALSRRRAVHARRGSRRTSCARSATASPSSRSAIASCRRT